MSTLLAIYSIVLTTGSIINGVRVSRASLFGYVVDGVVGTLTAREAATAVDAIVYSKAVDALTEGWDVAAEVAEAVTVAAVKAVRTVKAALVATVSKAVERVARTVKVVRQSFFTGVFEAFTALASIGTVSPWMATSPTGTEMVVARVYAAGRVTMGDDYEAAAKVALRLRTMGHKVVAVGNRVQVYATAA